MKVVWRAEMIMVCRSSYDLSQSLIQRGREREFSQYLAEIVNASEIRCTISAPSQEILKKVILGEMG